MNDTNAFNDSDTLAQTAETVRVWHAAAAPELPGETETFCERLMTDAERVAADRFRVRSARHQHVIGRAMARYLLSGDRWGPQEIEFRLLDHGKPVVDRPLDARQSFNVAHTKGLVLCGIGPRRDWIGVDVEWLDRRTDPDLAQRYFAASEIEQLNAVSSDSERQIVFLTLWTLKEAFIKAIGTGLHTPLDQFAFEHAMSSQPRLTVRDPDLLRDKHWRFASFQPRAGFIAAVAVGHSRSVAHDGVALRLCDFESAIIMNRDRDRDRKIPGLG